LVITACSAFLVQIADDFRNARNLIVPELAERPGVKIPLLGEIDAEICKKSEKRFRRKRELTGFL